MPSNSGQSKTVYLDACVLLAYINGDAGRVHHIEGILSDSSLTKYTSVLSVTEVAFAKVEQNSKALDPLQEQAISNLWAPGSPVEVAEFYELIAEEAKALIRSSIAVGAKLKPIDAIHLATAD